MKHLEPEALSNTALASLRKLTRTSKQSPSVTWITRAAVRTLLCSEIAALEVLDHVCVDASALGALAHMRACGETLRRLRCAIRVHRGARALCAVVPSFPPVALTSCQLLAQALARHACGCAFGTSRHCYVASMLTVRVRAGRVGRGARRAAGTRGLPQSVDAL